MSTSIGAYNAMVQAILWTLILAILVSLVIFIVVRIDSDECAIREHHTFYTPGYYRVTRHTGHTGPGHDHRHGRGQGHSAPILLNGKYCEVVQMKRGKQYVFECDPELGDLYFSQGEQCGEMTEKHVHVERVRDCCGTRYYVRTSDYCPGQFWYGFTALQHGRVGTIALHD